jgi:glycosyltransferase involved in cell wall biosynthesis
LQALIQDLDLSDHFRFDGGVANLRQHLAGADIFVLPSRSEGFSNAIVEAMAASLPVVATDVGGNAEAVKRWNQPLSGSCVVEIMEDGRLGADLR